MVDPDTIAPIVRRVVGIEIFMSELLIKWAGVEF